MTKKCDDIKTVVNDDPRALAQAEITDAALTRRCYRPPRLIRYGSLAQLTRSTASGKVADAGGKGKSGS